MAANIDVVVNGATRTIGAGSSIRRVIAELGLEGKRIAIEKNGEIVPRSAYDKTTIEAGDRLEIVAAVGGG